MLREEILREEYTRALGVYNDDMELHERKMALMNDAGEILELHEMALRLKQYRLGLGKYLVLGEEVRDVRAKMLEQKDEMESRLSGLVHLAVE